MLQAQAVLLRGLDRLGQGERAAILAKLAGAETEELAEQNRLLLLLLKAECEQKQVEQQGEAGAALGQDGQESAVLEAAKRARRSLAESFSGMMRRKASGTEGGEGGAAVPGLTVAPPSPVKPCPHPLSVTNAERRLRASPGKMSPLTPSKHGEFQCEVSSPGGGRQRARTVGAAGGEAMQRELARRRLARLQEEGREVESVGETEGGGGGGATTSPRLHMFHSTGAGRHASLASEGHTHRQQIYQVLQSLVQFVTAAAV